MVDYGDPYTEESDWAPAPKPQPVHWAPAPEPEPLHWAPAPEPEPAHWAPAPEPQPEPYYKSPAPSPSPKNADSSKPTCYLGDTRPVDNPRKYEECSSNESGGTEWKLRICAPGSLYNEDTNNCGDHDQAYVHENDRKYLVGGGSVSASSFVALVFENV